VYINAGFDAWILKPIDFKRLNVLLQGIVDDKTRVSCLYQQGNWEKGGWFHRGQSSAWIVGIAPVVESLTMSKPPLKGSEQPDKDSLVSGHTGSSESGSITPKQDPQHQCIVDERIKGSPLEGVERKESNIVQTDVTRLFDILNENPAT